MLAAFQSGDPDAAYRAAVSLIEAFQEQTHELARLRFTLNFGSPICENCDGLKAGPGVLATCYQTKQCNFNNIKDNANPRHLRVLNTLLDGK